MKRTRLTVTAALLCMAAFTGIASAADYTITWKNESGKSLSCPSLKVEVMRPLLGPMTNEVTFDFSTPGRTAMTVNSPSCTSINLSGKCIYKYPNGGGHPVTFSNTDPVPCGNSTATIDHLFPGHITVTPSQATANSIL